MAHWEHRDEPHWKDFRFNQPFAAGLKRLREDVLAKTDFDPAVLWQWGTVQALAVLELLKDVEARFGAEGQALARESLRKIGYETARQILAGVQRPAGISDGEYVSYFVTVINRILYASLERPVVEGERAASFDILWCPHQDTYGAFDCRVQRYFVVGILEAFRDLSGIRGLQVRFDCTIPAGAPTCHFSMWLGDGDESQWLHDTAEIEAKALRIAAAKG
jgi:hypothetical protein